MKRFVGVLLAMLMLVSVTANAALLADQCPLCEVGTLRFYDEDPVTDYTYVSESECRHNHPGYHDIREKGYLFKYYACDNCHYSEVNQIPKYRTQCLYDGRYYY